jgi:uncharacterized BrkB/YihY/UPF0761 family membrane protein
VESEPQSRTAALAQRLEEMRRRGEALPGAPVLLEAARNERELGGGLLAGGVAFRVFLWLVPFGLVAACVLSLWSEYDESGLESAAREFGIGAAAADAAVRALDAGERSVILALLVGLAALAWFTLGALRALTLAYSLAWRLEPRRIRPLTGIAAFNGFFLLATAAALVVAWLRDQLTLFAILGVAVSLAFTTGIALLAMWQLPHRATHPRELLPGALLVAVGYQLVQVVVLFYFAPELGEREETYGAFGAAAVMLIWLYVLSRLVTGAAFLNATIWTRNRAAQR